MMRTKLGGLLFLNIIVISYKLLPTSYHEWFLRWLQAFTVANSEQAELSELDSEFPHQVYEAMHDFLSVIV